MVYTAFDYILFIVCIYLLFLLECFTDTFDQVLPSIWGFLEGGDDMTYREKSLYMIIVLLFMVILKLLFK